MKKLQEIGNEIHLSIEVTVEYPSNNSSDRMPVLDIDHWLEEVEGNNGEKKCK